MSLKGLPASPPMGDDAAAACSPRIDAWVSGKNGALLRRAASLASEECGHLARYTRVFVVDAATVDGITRLYVRCAAGEGWCSSKVVKDVPRFPHALRETVRVEDDAKALWVHNAGLVARLVVTTFLA